MEVVDKEEGADAAHLQLSEVGVGGRGPRCESREVQAKK